MLTRATPLRLVKRSLLGAILSLAFLPMVLAAIRLKPLWLHAGPAIWIVIGLVAATPLFAAFFLSYSSEKVLRAGLLKDGWSESKVAEARNWLERPFVRIGVTCVVLLGLAGIFSMMLMNRRPFSSLGGFTYLMIMPAVTLGRLKQLVAAPSQPASRLWSNSMPLHSNHWGH